MQSYSVVYRVVCICNLGARGQGQAIPESYRVQTNLYLFSTCCFCIKLINPGFWYVGKYILYVIGIRDTKNEAGQFDVL